MFPLTPEASRSVPTMSLDNHDQPPSYDDVANDVNPILQPTIHVLVGQTIHAESADAPLLYRLNRGVASLSHTTSEVELERVDRGFHSSADASPAMRERTRHIYDLRLVKGVNGTLSSLPSDSPGFYAAPQNRRRSLGCFGLKKSRVPGRSSWKALPVDPTGKSSKWNLASFVKDGTPVFELKQKNGRYEWVDGQGKHIAVEDEGEDQHRLVVTASLPQQTVDALIALWCCRLWQYSAEHQDSLYEGVDGGKWPV